MIIRKEVSERWLSAGSSPVDWCEENYTVNGNIAEFTNTISNVLFILIPAFCLGARVWNSYSKHVSFGTYIQMYFLIIIGLSSVYFHATLSLLGQLLDEVAIIWSVCLAYASFMPNWMRPKFYYGGWAYAISVLAASLMTGAWFIEPHLNAFGMMTLTIPVIAALAQELTIYRRKETFRITLIALSLTLLAIGVWVADRLMCGVWQTMRIPGLHNVWHILIALGAYLTIIIFSYLKAINEATNIKPSIRYLPGKNWGIPYVHCKELLHNY